MVIYWADNYNKTMNKFESEFKAPTAPEEEQKIPKFTKEEWQNYCNRDVEDSELHEWMKEKGIEFDNGMIDVEIDGKKERMLTDKHDFGTCDAEGKETIKSGY